MLGGVSDWYAHWIILCLHVHILMSLTSEQKLALTKSMKSK